MAFHEWLDKIWQVEEHIDDEYVYCATKAACLEMIKTGTVTFNDQYWHMPMAYKAAMELGMRPALSYVVLDKNDPEESQRQKAQCQQMYEMTKAWDPKAQLLISIHAIYSVREPMMLWAVDFARERGLKIHIHISETRKEVEDCMREHDGMSPVEYLDSLGDDLTPTFVFGTNKGKKSQLYGSIVTCGFPIDGREGEYVQIDNIIVTNENEQKFQRKFLDLDAAKQGLVMGLMRVILHHTDREKILDHIGLVDLPKLSSNQEYEFVLSSAGLSFRLVTLSSEMKEVAREELWRSANWDLVEYILSDFDLSESYENLLVKVEKVVRNNERSRRRIVGIMKSMIRVGPGEVGTPKGDGKVRAIQLAKDTLQIHESLHLNEYLKESLDN
jgi:hypothetical protein